MRWRLILQISKKITRRSEHISSFPFLLLYERLGSWKQLKIRFSLHLSIAFNAVRMFRVRMRNAN